MARKSKEVSRNTLEASIRKAEVNGPLNNLNDLWESACDIYNSMDVPEKITKSVVKSRVSQWDIEIKTKAGNKFRLTGVKLTDEQKSAMQSARKASKPRAEKFASDPILVKSFADLKKETPERFKPLVDKLKSGSMRAAVALQCLVCSGYSTSEVRLCVCNTCPLYAFRPYKSKVGENNEIDESETDLVETDSEL